LNRKKNSIAIFYMCYKVP